MVTLLLKYTASDRSHLRMRWRVTEGLLPENPVLETLFLNGRKPLFVVVSMPVRLAAIEAAAKSAAWYRMSSSSGCNSDTISEI